MVNRAETLSNLGGLPDVTAWRAIRHADKANAQKVNVLPEEPNLKLQPPCRKSQLHQELTRLNMLKHNRFFNSKIEKAQFMALRRQFRAELQELEKE